MVGWVEIFGDATVFGVIVAIAAWLNGRRTTKILREVITAGNQQILAELKNQRLILKEILNELREERGLRLTSPDRRLNATEVLKPS